MERVAKVEVEVRVPGLLPRCLKTEAPGFWRSLGDQGPSPSSKRSPTRADKELVVLVYLNFSCRRRNL